MATTTPDQAFPATAVRVQAELGAGGFAFDIAAACSGFVYALSVADALIRAGQARGVLVIGAEVFSRMLNWEDRGTCVLFGDGAGAVFLRAAKGHGGAGEPGILSTHLHSDGRLGDILYVDGAVGRRDRPGHLVMNGREVFRHAVTRLADRSRGAGGERVTARTSTGWCRTRPTRASSTAIGRRLGCRPNGSWSRWTGMPTPRPPRRWSIPG